MGASTAVPLSGRDDELLTLLEVVRLGTSGSPQAVLVQGEAGVGKTALVRAVVERVQADGVQVLWGQALRFGAVEAAYHPLVLALEGWLARAGHAERAAIIDEIPAAALVLPSLGAAPDTSGSRLMTVVDALIGRVVARGPTLLVVDDVQWADPSTWDALAYLVAGFSQQPLALLATQRDEQAGSEDFQRWLGSIRRMPGTRELAVSRLGREATQEQVAILLGGEPSSGLVDQVYERSRGNPFFTELLVRRTPVGTDLPDVVPDELSRALLESWRSLDPSAREMTRLLAVAGRPMDVTTLASVAADLGVEVGGSLRVAVDAGVVVLDGPTVWFRHPLLSDVLLESYLPGEAAPVHAAWAGHLASTSTDGVDELRRLGDLATHQELAGADAAAFGSLLEAADVAEGLGVRREAADLLARAAALWTTGATHPRDDNAHARLLQRASRACERVDRAADAWKLIGRACDLVDPARDPLWLSTLKMAQDDLAWHLGLVDDQSRASSGAVLELTRADVDSREHADALAWTAENHFWAGQLDQATTVIADAMAAAERSRSDAALSHAFAIRSMLVMEADIQQAERDAASAWEEALASGEDDLVDLAYLSRWLVKIAAGDLDDLLAHAQQWREWDRRVSAGPWSRLALAATLMDRGDLVGLDPEVRSGLATPGAAHFEAATRLQAAVLSARRGLLEAARGHVARAYEVMPFLEERIGLESGPPLAEVLLALDRAGDALTLLEPMLATNAADPRMLDRLMLNAVQAVADLAQRGRDARDHDAVLGHREELERLVATRAGLPGAPFAPWGPRDAVTRARGALFEAEMARARDAPGQADRWRSAVVACAEAGMWWEHHTAAVRLAAALVEAGADRQEAARLLRTAHAYAVEQQALPLAARVEEVAALGRIALTAPADAPASVPPAFAGLTAREAEVLGHLVANRTYAEIATELFISEKTVSVHVSNLLRKTETSSRLEVAALARRLGWVATPADTGG